MSELGLIFIIIAWIYQFIYMLQKDHKIQAVFVIIYSLGVLLLVVDGFNSNLYNLAFLNLLSFLAAGTVLFKLGTKK